MRTSSLVWIGAAVALFGAAGCGTSGSNPTEFREIRILIEPNGGGVAQFEVVSLIAGGVSHPHFVGQQFTAPMTIALLNAQLPYEAKFKQLGTNSIHVRAIVSNSSETSADSSETTLAVVPPEGSTVSGSEPPASPEVQFNVCALLPGHSSCLTPTDPGLNGLGFSGTIGDPATTHVLPPACSANISQPCTTTPTVYFLEAARDSVNGVFNGGLDQPFRVELLIDGTVEESSQGTGDLILQKDI